jgi:DNA-binding MarR family transcriptional regulator
MSESQNNPPSLQDEIGKRRPFEHPEQEAYLNIMRTMSVLDEDVSKLFKSRGLSEATYNALRILRGEQSHGAAAGIPCQLIGERLISRVPDVTRLIDRLEAAGMVKRGRTDQDRRIVLVSITKKGLSLLEQLDAPLMDIHKMQFKHMTAAELAELNRLLVKTRHPETR